MKIVFYIFALLVFGHESYSLCDSDAVIYSPANPVEMVPSNCQTHNEKVVCGIYHRCYNQPFKCDKAIPFQITDENGDDFVLVVENKDGDEIGRFDFVPYEDISGNLFPSLGDFTNNADPGTGWTVDATPSVSLVGISSSKRLLKFKELIAGKYRIDYTITFGSNMQCVVEFYKSGDLVASEGLIPFFGSSPRTHTFEVFITSDVDTIIFKAFRGAPGSGSVEIISMEMVLLTYSYFTSFVPADDVQICDGFVSTRILNVTSSPEIEEVKSDALHISDSHECVNEIEYSNNKNYAGLIFQNVSPEPLFYLLVHSVFYHEQFPEEQFSMELTSGYESLGGVIKEQRKMEFDYLPYYMIRKLKIILKMQNILIDGFYWVNEDGVQQSESENKRFPLQMSSVLLTKRDSVQRSTL